MKNVGLVSRNDHDAGVATFPFQMTTSFIDSPPLHPRQRMQQLLEKIRNNDESMICVDFCKTSMDLKLLGQAIFHPQRCNDRNNSNDDDDDDNDQMSYRSNSRLKEIRLDSIGLDGSGFFTFTRAISHCSSLTTLHLSGIKDFTQDHIACLRQALEHHESLETLVLIHCHVKHPGLDVLTSSRLGRRLLNINLTGCNGFEDAPDCGIFLRRLIQHNPKLRRLIFSRNQVQGRACVDMLSGEGFYSLEAVNLMANQISSSQGGALALAQALARSDCCLAELNLAYNPLEDAGVALLARGLQVNRSLQMLQLKKIRLGDEGTEHLAHAIENNAQSQLQVLCLIDNEVGDKGAVALLRINHPSLKQIEFQRNRITDGEAIIYTLQNSNDSIEYLDVHFNKISVQQCRTIQFWTRLNKAGRRIIRIEDQNILARSLWSFVLARVSQQPDILYYFMSQKPDLCCLGRCCPV